MVGHKKLLRFIYQVTGFSDIYEKGGLLMLFLCLPNRLVVL